MAHVLYNLGRLRAPITGIGRYTIELIRTSLRLPDQDFDQITVDYNGRIYHGNEISDVVAHLDQMSATKSQLRNLAGRIPFSRSLFRLQSSERFGRLMSAYIQSGSIYHDTNYTPVRRANRSVATVYDLSHCWYPETHPMHRVQFLNRYFKRLKNSDQAIITISSSVKKELMSEYDVSPNRIRAIPLAADSVFRPRTEAQTTTVLKKYRLRYKRYLLSVGTLEPRKNLSALLSAYEALPQMLQRNFPLIIVGGHGWKTEHLERNLNRLRTIGLIRQLGFVAQADLPDLYAGAAAFAYVSKYEGFGLPLLEAMQSGAACITSNSGALSELAMDNALQVDPEDRHDIGSGLMKLLEDSELRTQFATKGQQRATDFSWAETARRTRQFYNEL